MSKSIILTCRHNRPVKVILETTSPICWDDGVVTYTADHRRVDSLFYEGRPEATYLEVTGCDICKLIEV